MSDYEYIVSKTQILETCNCERKQICGICFWKGVTISPEIGVNHKCPRCIQDNLRFKDQISHSNNTIIFEHNCFSVCMWWDWFHNIRKQIAAQNNIQVIYKRKTLKRN